jgi:peptidoglycan hydrolase-like protein with peptidoglycan-binding domain
MNPGTAVKFPPEQVAPLQTLLKQPNNFAIHKIDIGEIDGQLGTGTRAAVKIMQLRFNLPADAYPTMELMGYLSR